MVGLAEKITANQTTTAPVLLLNPSTTSQEISSESTTTIDPTTAGTSSATTSQRTVQSTGATTTKKSTTTSRTTSSNSSSTKSTTQNIPSGYIFLAPLSAISGKSYAYLITRSSEASILINYNGTWKAFSAVCTHAGCTVNFSSNSLYCPCHAGYFSANNGAVTGGPPPSALVEYDVKLISGNLYVGQTRIN